MAHLNEATSPDSMSRRMVRHSVQKALVALAPRAKARACTVTPSLLNWRAMVAYAAE